MLQYKHCMLGKNLPYLRLPHRTRFLAFAFYIYRDVVTIKAGTMHAVIRGILID